jgi:hypothetical protein
MLAAPSPPPFTANCGRTHDGFIACTGGAKLAPGSGGMPVTKISREQLLAAAGRGSGERCKPHFVMMLMNRTDRISIFKRNQKRTPDIVSVPAVDGVDREGALNYWRELGIRFHQLHGSQPRSFGAFACHLSYLRALRYQVDQRIPLMLTIEDDVVLGADAEMAACAAERQMRSSLFTRSTNHRRFGLVSFGDWGEAILTSLHGARGVLSYYCDRGIVTNKDYQLAAYKGALKLSTRHLGNRSAHVFDLVRAGGLGHIRETGHFLNGTKLRLESAHWPRPPWCPHVNASEHVSPLFHHEHMHEHQHSSHTGPAASRQRPMPA